MVQTSQDSDFRVQFAQVVGGDFVDIHDLDRAQISSDSVDRRINRPVTALPQALPSIYVVPTHT